MFSNKYLYHKNVAKIIRANNPEYTIVALEPGTELPLEQLREIVDAILCNPYIKVLAMNGHELDDESVKEIIRLKDHKGLKILNVSGNEITNVGMRDILNNMSHLEFLGMAENPITDNITLEIARSSIKEFDLYGTEITTNGAKYFFESNTITDLRLGSNQVDPDVYSALQRHFQANKENLEKSLEQKLNANEDHKHSKNHARRRRLHGSMHRTFSAAAEYGNHDRSHRHRKHHHSHK